MIFVTGASGLLGANFVLTAQLQNWQPIAAYHHHPIQIPGIDSVQADLTKTASVQPLLESFRPEWIVHFAGLTNVDWCEDHYDESYRLHVDASRHLASAARKISARFVYVSTDSVYDGEIGNYTEDHPTQPSNIYAQTKLAGEQAVLAEAPSSLIIRTNIYGWNCQEKSSLAEWVLNKLESRQRVPGFDDVYFTPILVNDLSDIILEMMDRRLAGLFHVAGSQPCSKFEFAQAIARVFQCDEQLVNPVSVSDSPLKAPRPRNTTLQTSKISQALQRPMPDLHSGLQQLKRLRESGFVSQLEACRQERTEG